jgi:hypothetical protein
VIERDRKGGAAWTRFTFPTWWHDDVLRMLEYLRRAQRLRSRGDRPCRVKRDDGRWPLETLPVEMDKGEGQPSRWITLRALRVLDWYPVRS